jgi:hypothetical protein
VDQIVNIAPAEDYIYIPVTEQVCYVTEMVLIYTDPFNSVIHSEIIQQLVINDATSTSSAQTADFEHSTEVPFNLLAHLVIFTQISNLMKRWMLTIRWWLSATPCSSFVI